jgi:carboxymethylenebutenolidase
MILRNSLQVERGTRERCVPADQFLRPLIPDAAPMTIQPHYIAIPKSGSGRGVLVLHSWWGLNPFFKGLCDRFSDNGFVALAPDLYGGKVASTVEAAKALRAKATATRREPAYKMLTAAINHLSRHEAVTTTQVAIVGFSMGGHWALWLAQRSELPIAATVIFYAARNGDFTRSGSRFLFHFAENDEWVSAASKSKLRKSLEAAGRYARYCDYPGTQHWFFESNLRDAFHREAAASAWKRTIAFLDEELRPAANTDVVL